MNRRNMKPSLVVSVLALLCLAPSLRLLAQETTHQQGFGEKGVESHRGATHRRYILKDLGTVGGPASGLSFFARILNNRGTVVGDADTSIPDPFAPYCLRPNCLVSHGFKWQNGVMTDLGTLPGGSSSDVNYINELGQITGRSQVGLIDPLTGAPAETAVIWEANGEIVNLGNLGGPWGLAVGINNSGQVIGGATNTIPDPFSFTGIFDLGSTTQTRAFLWQRGVMRDLGTLGGPDAFAQYINESGQVTGFSYTNSTPNATTGIPTIHTFIWENGRMTDIGSLGGTLVFPNDMNSRGQVIGNMSLPGDESQHPFLWERGTLTDLGTFGGSDGDATWMNDAGEVVGWANLPGNMVRHAFVWRHGVKKEIPPPAGDVCSLAFGINSGGQVVGTSGVCHGALHALLWENGSTIDLNTVIPPGSGLQLVYALSINDRGEIAGIGVPPGVAAANVGSLGHAFLLIPVEGDDAENTTNADSRLHPDAQEVGQGETGRTAPTTQSNAVKGGIAAPSRVRQANEDQAQSNRFSRFSRFHLPGRIKD